jgi:glucosamine--fructose-6-phosphate aminotransferase (isomerizing)
VILVSQSGESAEINRLLEQEAYQQSIAVTNDESSTLGIKSDVVLPLQAGEEKSITTKTYTNSLGLFLLMLAVFYGRKTLSNVCNELHYAADLLLKVTDNSLMDYVKAVYNNEKFIFIGRGPAFVSAQQSALTSMEGLRCLSAAFSGGAFNHGPFEAVDNNLPTIIYADKNSCTYDITKKLIDRISALCDTLLIITNDNHSFSSEKNIAVIPDMECTFPEEMFPILCSMTQYYLLNGIGRERNIELGNFKYGNKITRSE